MYIYGVTVIFINKYLIYPVHMGSNHEHLNGVFHHISRKILYKKLRYVLKTVDWQTVVTIKHTFTTLSKRTRSKAYYSSCTLKSHTVSCLFPCVQRVPGLPVYVLDISSVCIWIAPFGRCSLCIVECDGRQYSKTIE